MSKLASKVKEREEDFVFLDELFDRLFPICRSITGPGFRESLRILQETIPFEVMSFESGSQVFDWTVPEEWWISSGSLIGPDQKVYADFEQSNISVLNFSEAVDKEMSLEDLQAHLYSIPEHPDAIPYVTSYYKRRWGFCLPHRVRENLPQGKYKVKIVAEHKKGHLNCGHAFLPGKTKKEILLSSYLCHPSLANNELSGPLVLAWLYKQLAQKEDRYFSYRFVINPETIGSLCYLSRFGEQLKLSLETGMVLTCLGGPEETLSYKASRREDSRLDRMIRAFSNDEVLKMRCREFTPLSGSDERQYCSPGFNLPVGQMSRTLYAEYDGYHNSLDTKEFMNIETVLDSAEKIYRILNCYEKMGLYENTSPYGELCLGKRGLYPSTNSHDTWKQSSDKKLDDRKFLNTVLAILNYSDGKHDSVWIAEQMKWSPRELEPAIAVLQEHQVLKRITETCE